MSLREVSKKKLLAVPLCFALLLVPLVLNENPKSYLQPSYENGLFCDPLIPELIIPPDTTPNVTFTNTSSTTMSVSEESPIITVHCLLALEEDYVPYGYWTPKGHLNGYLYALLQIERASKYFEQVFDTDLLVCGEVTWHSTVEGFGEQADKERFWEAVSKTGFQKGMIYNDYKIDILIGWTLGFTTYFGLSDNGTGACVIRYAAYWVDDNTVQHEVSHLCDARDGTKEDWEYGYNDCWQENCIMSYREVHVDTYEEDGVIFTVNNDVHVALLYNDWCQGCYAIIYINRWDFWDYPSQNPHPLRCGCDC